MTQLLAATGTTLALGLALVPAVRELARRVGMVAAPRRDRWHTKPTALLGGVAIFGSVLIGFLVFFDAARPALPVFVAASLLFVVGLIDDVLQIRPALKLAAQIMAAWIVVFCGLQLPWTDSLLLNAMFTVLWMVGITNALNLLDNMDGLAAGIAAIAALFLSATFLLNGQTQVAVVPLMVLGASLAFLVYNFKPASIFMGDSGSMFLGAMLGGSALLSEYGRSRNLAAVLLSPVLIMAIPILDTALVSITRRLRGQPVSLGGRDHTSHRLVALGASERRAVALLYSLAIVSGGIALAVRTAGTEALLALVPATALLFVAVGLYLGTVPVARDGSRAAMAPDREGFDLGRLPRAVQWLVDGTLVCISYLLAYLLRWEFSLPPDQVTVLVTSLPLVVAIEMVALQVGGIYRELWHRARVEDLWVIARSTAAGATLAGFAVMAVHGFSGPSRGALVLNFILWMIAATTSRLSLRLFQRAVGETESPHPDARPVLVYGTNDRAVLVLSELRGDPSYQYRPVGFLQDRCVGARRLHGLPVFGIDDLVSLARERGIDAIVVSTSHPETEAIAQAQRLGMTLQRVRIELVAT